MLKGHLLREKSPGQQAADRLIQRERNGRAISRVSRYRAAFFATLPTEERCRLHR